MFLFFLSLKVLFYQIGLAYPVFILNKITISIFSNFLIFNFNNFVLLLHIDLINNLSIRSNKYCFDNSGFCPYQFLALFFYVKKEIYIKTKNKKVL